MHLRWGSCSVQESGGRRPENNSFNREALVWYVTRASGARAQPYGSNRIHTAGEWRSSSTNTTLKDDRPFTVCGESNSKTGASTAI
jgi:hypothetical protein